MIQTETATVYRGGGRRWFALDTAVKAEANAAYRAIVKAKGLCECGSQHIEGYGDIDDYCLYHDQSKPLYGRYIRYVSRIIKRGAQ